MKINSLYAYILHTKGHGALQYLDNELVFKFKWLKMLHYLVNTDFSWGFLCCIVFSWVSNQIYPNSFPILLLFSFPSPACYYSSIFLHLLLITTLSQFPGKLSWSFSMMTNNTFFSLSLYATFFSFTFPF